MQSQRNVGLAYIALRVHQHEGDRIALADAGEPVVILIIEIADNELRRVVVDIPKDIGSQGRAKGEALFDAARIFGPSRIDAGATVGNPAIREIDDNVLVGGVGRVVQFSSVDGHDRLWVQMFKSDVTDGKKRAVRL